MSLKTYTINTAGSDKGNAIESGFTIDIIGVQHYDEGEGSSFTKINTCTKNATGVCGNDDILAAESFAVQATNLTTDAVLTVTIEAKLDTVYGPSNWS